MGRLFPNDPKRLLGLKKPKGFPCGGNEIVIHSGTVSPNGLRLNGERSRAERVRCSRGLGPTPTLRSDLEKLRVIPDILMILGQKEAPTRRETEVRKHLGQQFGNVRNVMRLKEIGI